MGAKIAKEAYRGLAGRALQDPSIPHWDMGTVLHSCHSQYNCSGKLGFVIVSFTPNYAVFIDLVWCLYDPEYPYGL